MAVQASIPSQHLMRLAHILALVSLAIATPVPANVALKAVPRAGPVFATSSTFSTLVPTYTPAPRQPERSILFDTETVAAKPAKTTYLGATHVPHSAPDILEFSP